MLEHFSSVTYLFAVTWSVLILGVDYLIESYKLFAKIHFQFRFSLEIWLLIIALLVLLAFIEQSINYPRFEAQSPWTHDISVITANLRSPTLTAGGWTLGNEVGLLPTYIIAPARGKSTSLLSCYMRSSTVAVNLRKWTLLGGTCDPNKRTSWPSWAIGKTTITWMFYRQYRVLLILPNRWHWRLNCFNQFMSNKHTQRPSVY